MLVQQRREDKIKGETRKVQVCKEEDSERSRYCYSHKKTEEAEANLELGLERLPFQDSKVLQPEYHRHNKRR